MLKFRLISFFVFVGIYSLFFQIGAMSIVLPEDASSFVQDYLSSTQNIDGFGIFFSNASSLLLMFVPGVGVILGTYSAWSTGFGFAAFTTIAPSLAETEPLAILFYSPYGVMELIAYSIAMSRSFHVVYSIAKKISPTSLIKPSLLEIGISIGLLFFAGIIEEYMIGLSQ